MIVVNLFGEPGSGKSAAARGLTYALTINGIRVELAAEAAKGYAWETPKGEDGRSLNHPIFEQQIYLLGKQNRELERLKGKRDVVVTDCPLLMGLLYQKDDYLKSFKELALEQFDSYDNVNILLERGPGHKYDCLGRNENEEDSEKLREKLSRILADCGIETEKFKTNPSIHKDLMRYLNEKRLHRNDLNFDF